MGDVPARRSVRASLGVACLVSSLAAPALCQIDPATALLERAGWDALASGQPHAAAELFRQAVAADPKSARLRLGAGAAAYLERRDADAKLALNRALELDPKLTRARELLGLVLYRSGELDGAIRVYEKLVAETSDKARISESLERWRRESELRDRMTVAI